MNKNLTNWQRSGWLERHQASPQEIRELLNIADRDLTDCQTQSLSSDWKLSIAYNAALKSATAALAASGYRATHEAHHYRVIQSLAHTIGTRKNLLNQLDSFRRKRNISDYDRAGTVSDQEAEEMFKLARTLRSSVEKWLRKNYPQLLP